MLGREDPKRIVARGYDAIALRYAEWKDASGWPTMTRLKELLERLEDGSKILELGCGRGVPATRELAKRHEVVGVDISSSQIALARHHVPEATFVQADVMELELPPESFDAVVSIYMFGHIPPDEQGQLVERIAEWLRPGGRLLTTMGARDDDAPEMVEDDWLGAPMYFAGVGREKSLGWIESAGLEVERADVLPQLEHGEEVCFLWVLAREAVTEVRRVGVVGLGTMGAGIAQLAVEAGLETVGREVEAELGERARDRIAHFLTRKVEKGRMGQAERDAAVERLHLTTDLSDLADCDIVIEAVLEELSLKRELFAELDRVCRPDAVLATNTSALSVTEIAAATERPQRVVGMHFFNPAPLMPLVEIVRTELTADEPFERAYALGERLGKTPIRCHDTPGFVVNRVLIPLMNDCIRVLDEARVTPEALDAGMKHGAGWPMGPCELLDLIGIDIHVHASEALYEKLREPRMAPPPRLIAMANAGLLGRKSGRGFFTYDD